MVFEVISLACPVKILRAVCRVLVHKNNGFILEQESIPVWCVLSAAVAAHRVCIPTCTGPWGVYLGGVCPGGVCLGGVCPGDVCPRGVYPSMHCTGVSVPVHAGIHPHTLVKTLPFRNYTADGNQLEWILQKDNISLHLCIWSVSIWVTVTAKSPLPSLLEAHVAVDAEPAT